MMIWEAFQRSLSDATPPDELDLALQALWWASKGEWDRAHGCAQQNGADSSCDHVHAYLHRLEGDLANARYWYGRAGQPFPTIPLHEEWEAIAMLLLSSE